MSACIVLTFNTSVLVGDNTNKGGRESRREWLLGMMETAGKSNSQNLNFQLWQQDNHPIALPTLKILYQKLDYTHNNPVEAGIVERPEDYLYSSARDYCGFTGLIEINLVEPKVL